MQMMWTPFVNQSAPHESARYQNDNCRRSFPFRDGLILYISQESQDDCLNVDFVCFKLALWPTLRQKFMNFWSFLTRPGDKHDEKISNCSSTKLTILPWVSRFFNFSLDKTPNLMVFSEISFWNEVFHCSIKTEMFTVAESSPWIASCKRLRDGFTRHLWAICVRQIPLGRDWCHQKICRPEHGHVRVDHW